MSITVECEQCLGTFNVREGLAGRELTCPECGGPVIAILETEQPVRRPEPSPPRGAEPKRRTGTPARPAAAIRKSTRPTNELPPDEQGTGHVWMVLGGLALSLLVLIGLGIFVIRLMQAPAAPQAPPIVQADKNANGGTATEPGRQTPRDASAALKYSGAPGDVWVYEATIEIDTPDFVETHQGQLTYQITAVRETEFDLTSSGMLQPSRRRKATNRDGLRGFPDPFADRAMTAPFFGTMQPKQLTVDRTGKLIRQASTPGFPGLGQNPFRSDEPGYKGYLLDDASLLPFERLAEKPQPSWSHSQDLNVTLKQFVRLSPHSPFGRETESTLGGKETIEFSVKDATTSLVMLHKKYSLTAGGSGVGKSLELSGEGWVRFDAKLGATVSSEMKLTLKQTTDNVTVNVPISMQYRKLTNEELATLRERAQAALAARAVEKEKSDAQPNAGPSATTNAAAPAKTAGPLAPLAPTDSLVLPQPAVDEQGQFLSDDALKAIFVVIRAPALGNAVTPETPLDVGSIVVAKKPGAGDRLAAVRELKEDEKLLVGFLGDTVEPFEASRAELRLPPETIAKFVSASAFAITPKTELRPGMLLETDRGANRWRPVFVLETLADGKVKIRYVGWSTSWDSAVERSKLRFPTGMSSER